VFTFIKINQPLLAVDKENRHYILLNEQELHKCTRDTHSHADRISSYRVYHVSCKSERTMRGENLYKRAWTAPKLRTETCLIQYNFVDYLNRDIMGVLNNRKSKATM